MTASDCRDRLLRGAAGLAFSFARVGFSILDGDEMKSGIYSTEFWLTFIVVVGGLLSTAYADAEWARIAGIVAATLSTMGYGHARAQVKKMDAAAVSVASRGVR